MSFSILVEDFGSNQRSEDFDADYVGAVMAATEASVRHDTDFVYLLSNHLPIGKYVDGKEVKL